MIARAGIAMRFQDKLNPPQAEKGNTMSENKKAPDLELETLEDDDLKDVAGGVSVRSVMPIGRIGRNPENPSIPQLPSDQPESNFSGNTTGVKR